MARVSARLALCLGMFILLGCPAAWALAPSSPSRTWQTAPVSVRPRLAGFSLLQVAPIQREADYTKERKAYVLHTTGLIALGLGLGFILVWRFGLDLALRLRGDPLPKRVRTRLDRLESVRLSVIASVRACKAQSVELESSEEKQAYERLAAAAGSMLDKVRRDLLLNFVDEDFLVPELEDLIDRGQALSFRLRRLAPVPSPEASEKGLAQSGWTTLDRINRGWERVLAGKAAKLTTIQQLNAMRWPLWSSLTGTLKLKLDD